MFNTIYSWEYRLRLWLLFGSKPIFALAVAAAYGTLDHWYAPEFHSAQAVCGTLLATLGILIRLWASACMDDQVVSSLQPDARELVTGGPYSWSRNPLYVGTMLIFAGYGCFFGTWAAALFVAFHILRYERMIRFEEQALEAEWGDQFHEFRRATNRWLPSRFEQFARMNLRGPYLSREAILLNGWFVGMWLGLLASAWTGSLATLIPIETVGAVTAGFVHLAYRRQPSALESLPAELRGPAEISAAIDTGSQRVA